MFPDWSISLSSSSTSLIPELSTGMARLPGTFPGDSKSKVRALLARYIMWFQDGQMGKPFAS
jgi:hypothetical protein